MTGGDDPAPLRVGMVGYAFMGRAHTQGWRGARTFFDLPLRPELVAVCGRDPARAGAAARRLGWSEVVTDWRSLIDRDDIDLVDICTPGSAHADIAVAALEGGKHVVCEKPLANTVEEAERMTEAAAKAALAGVRSMVGFNYRRVPAVELARRLIGAGRLGPIRHVRAAYLQDWIVDPEFPLVWRLRAEEAGSGALGDIGSHIVDLAQTLIGQTVTAVSGLTETFVKERPGGSVTVDDAAVFVARFSGGAIGTFEATRFATGRKNALRIEVNGSAGSVAFDLERLNELEVYETGGGEATPDVRGFRKVLVTEADHPWVGGWWPPGHVLGWEHTFSHELKEMVDAIAAGRDPEPSFADGLAVQRVLAAVIESAATGRWVDTGAPRKDGA